MKHTEELLNGFFAKDKSGNMSSHVSGVPTPLAVADSQPPLAQLRLSRLCSPYSNTKFGHQIASTVLICSRAACNSYQSWHCLTFSNNLKSGLMPVQ